MNRTRWIILALLFAGTTINYMDRIVLSVLLPVIKEDIHITPIAYGYITGAFQFTYTACCCSAWSSTDSAQSSAT